jgi:hypothetical protein
VLVHFLQLHFLHLDFLLFLVLLLVHTLMPGLIPLLSYALAVLYNSFYSTCPSVDHVLVDSIPSGIDLVIPLISFVCGIVYLLDLFHLTFLILHLLLQPNLLQILRYCLILRYCFLIH